MSRDWMSVAEIAVARSMTPRGVRYLLERLEKTHRRRLREMRTVRGKKIVGVSARALQDALEFDTGKRPTAPELRELQEKVESHQRVLGRMMKAVVKLCARHDLEV